MALLRPLDLSVEGHYGSNTKARISTSGLTRILTERYGFMIKTRRVECTLLSSRSRFSLRDIGPILVRISEVLTILDLAFHALRSALSIPRVSFPKELGLSLGISKVSFSCLTSHSRVTPCWVKVVRFPMICEGFWMNYDSRSVRPRIWRISFGVFGADQFPTVLDKLPEYSRISTSLNSVS